MVFTCASPSHHDGDAIRCAGQERSMRLQAIDAPEMPGACRPGRRCTPGDPYASRDYLRSLTKGRNVICEEQDIDSYGRRVVRCLADGQDISCAMVASGHAVERYARLNCNAPLAAPEEAAQTAEFTPAAAPDDVDAADYKRDRKGRMFAPADAPVVRPEIGFFWLAAGVWLMLANLLGWIFMDMDKARLAKLPIDPQRRDLGGKLLLVAMGGGGAGMLAAQVVLDHRTGEQPFTILLLLITGVQLGLIAGITLMTFL